MDFNWNSLIDYTLTTFQHGSGVDLKFDVEWKYLLCFIFAHTAFLLSGAEYLIKMSYCVKRFLWSTGTVWSPAKSNRYL